MLAKCFVVYVPGTVDGGGSGGCGGGVHGRDGGCGCRGEGGGSQATRPPWSGSSPYLRSSLATSTAPWSTATWRALLKMRGDTGGEWQEELEEYWSAGSSLEQSMDKIQ